MNVEQLAWTLLGLLAAQTLGSFYYLGSRIDRLFTEIGSLRAEMGELRGEMNVLRHSFETYLKGLHG